MAEVKWIKINVDMFDDEKIKIIQSMPEGDALLVVWIKLITLAGKTNDGGYIYIAEGMPYTDEMLSVIMNKPLNTIRLALDTFARLGMIENDVKGIYLLNFEKHQSLDKLAEIREKTRQRVAKHREQKKLLSSGNECNVTETLRNALDKDIDIDIDIDIDKDKDIKNKLSKEQLENEFKELWSMYPKKQGRSNAFKSFEKAIKNGTTDFEKIKEAIIKYKEYVESVEWLSYKNGSTWFNQECWNDDYTIVEKKGGNNNAEHKGNYGGLDLSRFE